MAFPIGSGKEVIATMQLTPAWRADSLFHSVRDLVRKGHYDFEAEGHLYFGHCLEKEVFGQRMYLYFYVDEDRALESHRVFVKNHKEEFAAMTLLEKDREKVSGSYFILISNLEMDPEWIFALYHGRLQIEDVFKTAKTYLCLLPLSKWKEETVLGKILSDKIATILWYDIRRIVNAHHRSVNDLYGKCSALMCHTKANVTVAEMQAALGLKA